MGIIKILRKHVPVGMCFRYRANTTPSVVSNIPILALPLGWDWLTEGGNALSEKFEVELLEHYFTHPEPTPLLVVAPDGVQLGDIIVARVDEDGIVEPTPDGRVQMCTLEWVNCLKADDRVIAFNKACASGFVVRRGVDNTRQAAMPKHFGTPPPRTADGKTAAECLAILERARGEVYMRTMDGQNYFKNTGEKLTDGQLALARDEWSRVLREKIAMSAVEDARKDAVVSGWDPYGDGDS